MKNLNSAITKNEKIFVVFTDVVESCKLDKSVSGIFSNYIEWRKESFVIQLQQFLNSNINIEIIKSIGDALFLKSTFTNGPTNNEVKLLLKSLVNVFDECEKAGIAIRIAIHCLGNQYSHGVNLAKILEPSLKTYKNTSIPSFIDCLKRDLFGTDINKTARIQGLVKKPTILVTEDVVKLLELETNKNVYKFDGCILHHPAPVTFLKGIFDYSDKNINGTESKEYIKVWELSSSNSDKLPVLSMELKQFQALRFLNADVDFSDFTPKKSNINEIYREAKSKIFKDTEREELQTFHTDIRYRIHDIYRLSKIDFTRPSSKKLSDNTFCNFKEFRKDNSKIRKIEISSLFNTLNITADNNSEKLLCSIDLNTNSPNGTLSFIPYLLMSSFPSQEIASKLRSIYSFKSEKKKMNGKVIIIEPQTIQLYKHIDVSITPTINSKERDILLFFGVYNNFIDQADEEKLFDQSELNSVLVISKAILSGLVDGFIIYKSTSSNLNRDISQLLNKLFSNNKTRSTSFFDRVFPISLFIISAEDVNKANIKILKLVKET